MKSNMALPGHKGAAKRPGRPCLGDATMSASERMARSRKAAQSKAESIEGGRYPVQMSATVDYWTRFRLNQAAKAKGITLGQMLDELVGNFVTSCEMGPALPL